MNRHIHTRRRIRRKRMLVFRGSSRLRFRGRVVMIIRSLSCYCCCSCRRSRSIHSLRRDETGLACVDCAGGGVAHRAVVPVF
jgi:hypothetical protein